LNEPNKTIRTLPSFFLLTFIWRKWEGPDSSDWLFLSTFAYFFYPPNQTQICRKTMMSVFFSTDVKWLSFSLRDFHRYSGRILLMQVRAPRGKCDVWEITLFLLSFLKSQSSFCLVFRAWALFQNTFLCIHVYILLNLKLFKQKDIFRLWLSKGFWRQIEKAQKSLQENLKF
jgi:hypothetical protein